MAAAPNPANDPNRKGARKRPALLPLLIVVGALLAGLLIFTLTRSGENYREEEFPQDPPETTT